MKPSHPADARSAPTNYAPSVPMTVYRELAAELRANKAVIDSLNSRNQQLLQQNQMLKQEIHNVVQATLSLGQIAGVARQAPNGSNGQGLSREFPSAIAPDTLAKLVRSNAETASENAYEPHLEQAQAPMIPYFPQSSPSTAPAAPTHRVPRPIAQSSAPQQQTAKTAEQQKASEMRAVARDLNRAAAKNKSQNTAKKQASRPRQQPLPKNQLEDYYPAGQTTMTPVKAQKLFTDQPGKYPSTALDASENKEIGGIWLVLSIVLIIVTAFGAGFLIMKPLLNDR
ncbi:MAG: putative coiled-coil domain-containing protein [Phormidesmis priestleyi Ana]|uniref:Putative coiled-coil domain-containing protein n=1 Tax=Phormidesmis priestleyi Ana TaxID=1666911 RepID=A0A0P7ZVG9_9CYAN|nr:MAG: putative coiled-coil domain-containing protein [Phormidesmis priestleyi Ana]